MKNRTQLGPSASLDGKLPAYCQKNPLIPCSIDLLHFGMKNISIVQQIDFSRMNEQGEVCCYLNEKRKVDSYEEYRSVGVEQIEVIACGKRPEPTDNVLTSYLLSSLPSYLHQVYRILYSIQQEPDSKELFTEQCLRSLTLLLSYNTCFFYSYYMNDLISLIYSILRSFTLTSSLLHSVLNLVFFFLFFYLGFNSLPVWLFNRKGTVWKDGSHHSVQSSFLSSNESWRCDYSSWSHNTPYSEQPEDDFFFCSLSIYLWFIAVLWVYHTKGSSSSSFMFEHI